MRTLMLAEEGSSLQFSIPKSAKVVNVSKFSELLLDVKHESVWVPFDFNTLKHAIGLLNEDVFRHQSIIRKHSRVFLLGDMESFFSFISSLESLFKDSIILPERSALPLEEALEIINDKHPENYIIGGHVELDAKTLSLIRGDLSRLVVPLSIFKQSGEGLSPDFSNFTVDDYGQTLKFGEYEASVDSVLYEFDSVYRKKKKANLIKKDRSFGACLRRLRTQKGFNQSDFSIDAREIGRIERGEVKPRSSTINKIAKDLGVEPKEIKTY